MKAKTKVCGTCHGTGHDKASRPAVKFVPAVDDDGKEYKQHVTLSQGSGCISCQGCGCKEKKS